MEETTTVKTAGITMRLLIGMVDAKYMHQRLYTIQQPSQQLPQTVGAGISGGLK